MKPYYIYLRELVLRTLYIFGSYLLCWCIFFNYIEIFFLFEVLPFLIIFPEKNFIVTQLPQLINSIWFFTHSISYLLIYPLLIYHIKYFFVTSWYKYQNWFYQKIMVSYYFFFIFIYLFLHVLILPDIFIFFLRWENLDENSLLKIEVSVTLISYIIWTFTFKYLISFLLASFLTLYLILLYFFKVDKFYIFVLQYKKISFFFLFSFFLFVLPPDLILELLLAIIIFIFIETLIFSICLKIYIYNKNNIFKNANNKTVIEKS